MAPPKNYEDVITGKAYDGKLVRRLLQYLLPYKSYIAIAFVALTISTAAELFARVYIYVLVIDYLIAENRRGDLAMYSLLYAALLGVMFVCQYIQFYYVNLMSQKSMKDLRSHLFQHLEGMSLPFFNSRPVGSLMTRLTSDIEALDSMFANCVVYTFSDILLIVGLLGFMLYMSPALTLITLLILPFIILATIWFKNGVRVAYRDVRRLLSKINGFMQENISGINTIQIFAREKQHFSKYRDMTTEFKGANMKSVFHFAVYYPLVEFLGMLAVVMLFLYGGGMNLMGQTAISIGTLVAFIKASQLFFQPIRDLADKYNIMQTAMAASERVFHLLDLNEKLPVVEEPVRAPLRGEIEFRNVWFAYNDEDWVLKDVSFTAKPGEHIAIVGATGSGKSTIINLVFRFYDAQRGEILIDGIPITHYDPQSLRSQIGLVLQDLFLFSGDIANNISLQREDISEETIVEAAKVVQADPFIRKMSHGYQSEVKERGATLSNGQRQLLSFARALAINPRVLVLDEATSSVDTETEFLIQQALDELMKGRTTLAVAHRLSTIQKADEILVLSRGAIIERGNHHDLLEQRGHYYRLYLMQYREQATLDPEEATA